MGAIKLDPNTRNNDTGIFWPKTRRVGTLPYEIGELATGLVAKEAGDVVSYNELIDETNIMSFEAGEWKPIVFTKILSGATIDGQPESTTVTNMIWTTSGSTIGK